MSDIVEFLTARLDEDEAAARVACNEMTRKYARTNDGEWRASSSHGGIHTESSADLVVQGRGFDFDLKDGVAVHIARHDPARVLRNVAAQREIVKAYVDFEARVAGASYKGYDALNYHRHMGTLDALRGTLRLLAAVYANHSDYQEGWKP